MIVCGIDPGHSGAFAVFDSDTGALDIEDMPTWKQSIGKKQRTRMDFVGVRDYFEKLQVFGVDLVVIEAVGGRPKQGAQNAFVFGFGVGLITMAMTMLRLPFETTPPNVWKRLMRVPTDDEGIAKAFEQRFPQHVDKIRGGKATSGPRKGQRSIKHDRAEAALLAMFGAQHIQPGLQRDPTNKLVYDKSKMELGA